MDVASSDRFCRAAESLLASAEMCLSDLVAARFRLRDVLAWIRATASRVKARGTAADSVMRENAKKRRAADATVRRVAEMLSPGGGVGGESGEGGLTAAPAEANLTERILGLPLSAYFSKESSPSPSKQERKGFESPLGSYKIVDERLAENKEVRSGTPSVQSALVMTSYTASVLFDQPRRSLAQAVQRMDIRMSQSQDCDTARQVVAIHRRVGSGTEDATTNLDENKCFLPGVVSNGKITAARERNWIVLAMAAGAASSDEEEVIQIVAIPCSHSKVDTVRRKPPFYLTISVALPVGCTLVDMAFYGDDGCSLLTSAADVDRGSGEEGRQALGVLLEREVGLDEDVCSQVISEELWVFPYDGLPYQEVALSCDSGRNIEIQNAKVEVDCYVCVEGDDEFTIVPKETNNDQFGGVLVKWRQVREFSRHASSGEVSTPSRIMLSGSRGIGGIITNAASALELFDLEEDEENEEDEFEEE